MHKGKLLAGFIFAFVCVCGKALWCVRYGVSVCVCANALCCLNVCLCMYVEKLFAAFLLSCACGKALYSLNIGRCMYVLKLFVAFNFFVCVRESSSWPSFLRMCVYVLKALCCLHFNVCVKAVCCAHVFLCVCVRAKVFCCLHFRVCVLCVCVSICVCVCGKLSAAFIFAWMCVRKLCAAAFIFVCIQAWTVHWIKFSCLVFYNQTQNLPQYRYHLVIKTTIVRKYSWTYSSLALR